MRLKVCGLSAENDPKILNEIKPDFVGAIHYKKSSRHLTIEEIKQFYKGIINSQKVLVTVNLDLDKLNSIISECQPNLVQLHGTESPEYIAGITGDVKIIKAFRVSTHFDFESILKYDNVDYFLFDYKGKKMGGNGFKFNWDLLKKNKSKKPFFLSGGIGMMDIEKINKLEIANLYAVDINSKFERQAKIKDLVMINEFKNRLK